MSSKGRLSTLNANQLDLPVIDKDAGAGGDCFFFAIYEALSERERQLIDTLMDMYGPFRLNKNSFNLFFRNLIATKINANYRTPATDYLRELYSLITSAYENAVAICQDAEYNANKCIVDVIADELQQPHWLVKDYIKATRKDSQRKFIELVSASIRQPHKQVQELEYNLAKELLGIVGIDLQLVLTKGDGTYEFAEKTMRQRPFSLPFSLPLENKSGQPIIYVIINSTTGHYSYFCFFLCSAGGAKRTRRKRSGHKRSGGKRSGSKRTRRSQATSKLSRSQVTKRSQAKRHYFFSSLK
jgi:hypothetical protein